MSSLASMDWVFGASETRQLGSGSVVGPSFVRLDSTEFPAPGWRDFPVVVASWWLQALEALPLDGRAEVDFMDGPFVVRLEADGPVVVVALVDAGRAVQVFYVDRGLFRTGVLSHAAAVLACCDERGFVGVDVELLRRSLMAVSDS